MPNTVNTGLIVPNTGDLVDTWGSAALNPDFVAIDGMLAGVATIGVTNAPVTLTAPAGAITPSPGPVQSQNKVLRFTGTLTGDVRVTLPLPGSYIIENLTFGAFVLSFQGVTATEVIATEQGSRVEVYNDGANVRFVNLGRVGALEFWGGEQAIPAWVTACTVKPYLLADGVVFNWSDYPYLGRKYLAKFGGNGTTTSATPDLRGRVPLAYDGTGTRITVAGSGIDGQVVGAAGGQQSYLFAQNQLPNAILPLGGIAPGTPIALDTIPGIDLLYNNGSIGVQAGGNFIIAPATIAITQLKVTLPAPSGNTRLNGNVTQVVTPIVQPSQVTGIWVVKT